MWSKYVNDWQTTLKMINKYNFTKFALLCIAQHTHIFPVPLSFQSTKSRETTYNFMNNQTTFGTRNLYFNFECVFYSFYLKTLVVLCFSWLFCMDAVRFVLIWFFFFFFLTLYCCICSSLPFARHWLKSHFTRIENTFMAIFMYFQLTRVGI